METRLFFLGWLRFWVGGEFEVISQCFNFIFDNLGKSLLLNNKGIQVANLDEDNLESFANDILFEDYKNNISLKK